MGKGQREPEYYQKIKEICESYRIGSEVSHLPEYNAWISMKDRCYNNKNISYKRYGLRGIIVYEEWKNDFILFLSHVGPRPSSKHSLDRKNNNGNYEPGNIRWATRVEQNLNRKSNRLLTYKGETKSVKEWPESLGINSKTIIARLNINKMSVTEAFETPIQLAKSRKKG